MTASSGCRRISSGQPIYPRPSVRGGFGYDLKALDACLRLSGANPPVNVPERMKRCAIFLGNKEDGHFRPRATAFAVSVTEEEIEFRYMVTAEHNIVGFMQKNWELWVRTNLTTGGAREEKLALDGWWFHPDNEAAPTDVAVSPVTRRGDDELMTLALNGPQDIAGRFEVLQSRDIGIGDEVSITGLFRSHYGRERNVPIIRIGNIAMMRGEPVYTDYCGLTDAYLIEARSISGLSGSPVFVNVSPVAIRPQLQFATGQRFLLLGLMHGHFDIKNLNEDVVLDDERDGTTGINTGIGVVIPVEKIIETVNQPELIEMRRKAVKEHRESRGATPDFADDPPSTDANPKHREDFTALVNEAARKPRQDD